jgi:hypothetical protein
LATEFNEFDLSGFLDEVKAALDDSRAAFLTASDARDPPLNGRARDKTEPYFAAENERDPIIVDAANGLVTGLFQYGELETQIHEWVAYVLLRVSSNSLEASIKMLEAISAAVVPSASSLQAGVTVYLGRLDDAGRLGAAAVAQVATHATRAAVAIQDSADLVNLRQAELLDYVSGSGPADPSSLLKAGGKLAALEGGYAVFEEIIRQVAAMKFVATGTAAIAATAGVTAAGVTTAGVALIPLVAVPLVRIALDLRKEREARRAGRARQSYGRDDLDDMLALSRRIAEGNDNAADLIGRLRALA